MSRPFNVKIGARLYLGYAAVSVIMVGLLSLAYNSMDRLDAANDMNTHTHEVMGQVKGTLESLVNIETGERGFALTGNPASLEPYEAGKVSFEKHAAEATKLTADNPRQQERLRALVAEKQKWMDDAVEPVIALRKHVTDGNIDPVVAFIKQGRGKRGMDAMRGLIDEIIGEEKTLLEQRMRTASDLRSQTNAIMVVGGLVAVILAFIIAYTSSRKITVPLREAVDFAKRVADGDLTSSMQSRSNDEIGELLQALGSMNDSLLAIVKDVRGGTDAISTASGEISAGSLDLSARTEQQAASLEETASSMDQITSTVKQNADNARQASQLAAAASNVASRGGMAVSEVVDTMAAINRSAKSMSDIIGVIDSIAFQTNILALNASVEAARAGEQGRGFAVVATEVRNLAHRSAAAAKEIKGLIDVSVGNVDRGNDLVERARSTIEEVVTSVRQVNDIIMEIASASDEQQDGIEQVNKAISQIDQVTQQNAALVEETAAASTSMQDQARQLSLAVGAFRIAQSKPRAAAGTTRQLTSASTKSAGLEPTLGR